MPTKPAKPKRRKKLANAKRKTPPKKRGRPSKFSPAIAREIIAGLSAGTPLTILCASSRMPSDDTVRNWATADPGFSRDIARAREAGFDRIALDALAIADAGERDTIAFEKNGQMVEIPDKEWMLRSKLRVETRLKLLAKWDPKRYGEKVTTEISGPDGKPIKSETSHRVSEELQDQILQRTADAARIAANVSAPASFRGEEVD